MGRMHKIDKVQLLHVFLDLPEDKQTDRQCCYFTPTPGGKAATLNSCRRWTARVGWWRVFRWCPSAVRASFSMEQQRCRKTSRSWKMLSKLRWNLRLKLNFTGKMVCATCLHWMHTWWREICNRWSHCGSTICVRDS